MNQETYEALKSVIKETRFLIDEKYGHRKRLTQDEIFRKAILYRDIVKIENWIDETSKEQQ